MTEPAIIYKSVLTDSSYKLLNKLVLDLKQKLPAEERVLDKKDAPKLVYNLFKGKYEFSYSQFDEILNVLIN